jgi:hypothetical protein
MKTTTNYPATIWSRRREARKRWSLNAVRKRQRNQAERLAAPIPDEPFAKVFVPPRSKPDLKVILERKDGMRLQYSLNNFYGKLIGQHVQMSPMEFGRRLGVIFKLWSMA